MIFVYRATLHCSKCNALHYKILEKLAMIVDSLLVALYFPLLSILSRYMEVHCIICLTSSYKSERSWSCGFEFIEFSDPLENHSVLKGYLEIQDMKEVIQKEWLSILKRFYVVLKKIFLQFQKSAHPPQVIRARLFEQKINSLYIYNNVI